MIIKIKYKYCEKATISSKSFIRALDYIAVVQEVSSSGITIGQLKQIVIEHK